MQSMSDVLGRWHRLLHVRALLTRWYDREQGSRVYACCRSWTIFRDKRCWWISANSSLSRIHPSTRGQSFTSKRMDARKYENWTCIGSHDQFSALQVRNWNSNWVREPRRFSILGQNFLWNGQIRDRFYWRQHRNSCRSTRRANSTNKHKRGCSQVKGQSKTSTERNCWDDSNHTDARQKMDCHWAIRTKYCLVRSFEESEQSSSTQWNVTERRRWSNWILQNFSIFGIIIHKYNFGLMIVGKLVWQQEEVRKEDISIALIIREQFLSTSVLFKDILETILLILCYRTMWWLELEYSLTFTMWDAPSIFVPLSTMDWYLGQNLSRRQTVFFLLVDPSDESHRDPEYIDFSVPRLARYVHSAWKRHQDAVFWVDIELSIKEGFSFYQTRSIAIILQGTLPAYCIPKVVRLKTGEVLYEKAYMSPRPPPKISPRHDHNWTKGNDHVPFARLELRWSRPSRPMFNPLVKSLAAWMAANGMTHVMAHTLLVLALRLPAVPDAAAPAPALQQDARVPLPVPGDVSMDLTAELAGIIDVSEEEVWLRAQALRFEETFEARAEQHFGSWPVGYEWNMAERTQQDAMFEEGVGLLSEEAIKDAGETSRGNSDTDCNNFEELHLDPATAPAAMDVWNTSVSMSESRDEKRSVRHCSRASQVCSLCSQRLELFRRCVLWTAWWVSSWPWRTHFTMSRKLSWKGALSLFGSPMTKERFSVTLCTSPVDTVQLRLQADFCQLSRPSLVHHEVQSSFTEMHLLQASDG